MLSCIRTALTGSTGNTVASDKGHCVVTTWVLLKTTDSFGFTCDRSGWVLPAGAHNPWALQVPAGPGSATNTQKLARATASSLTSPPPSGLTSEMPPNSPPSPITRSVGWVTAGSPAHPGGFPGDEGWRCVIATSVAPVT